MRHCCLPDQAAFVTLMFGDGVIIRLDG